MGLGEPIFDKIDALIAHAIMSIPAVKGVEIGLGFQSAESRGEKILMRLFIKMRKYHLNQIIQAAYLVELLLDKIL